MTKKIKKILIANRGEIACRVIKTARKMGIKTIAVYSDADKNALHVEMADEAVHIGAAPASESYLIIDKIINACKDTGADAVHPGYGFLSENKDFCKKLKAKNIIFIGPNVKAIEAMGDKIASKKLAKRAGVNCVPGHIGLIKNANEAVKISREIGYPVMIKASAGGGGKGMRIAFNDEEAKEGFQASKNEAKSSFGDDRIFIEKFIENPRHIEIQILGDKHGNIIHLGERECSIQRRNQKVIEEAPSPFVDKNLREEMANQAIALAKIVDYDSAGTVELIAAPNGEFYFLEMNTRLQVEHPVTELITGVDLVEQMINVAAGEKLKLKQKDIGINGWAIESRIYAEDPLRNFLPSIGRLSRYRPPKEGKTEDGAIIRNDTGVYEGAEISMYYDPMIAKLCTWGEDRGIALRAMQMALDGFEISGVGHNIPFLAACYEQDRFIRGDLSTNYIDEEFAGGFVSQRLNPGHARNIASVCTLMAQFEAKRAATCSNVIKPRPIPTHCLVQIGEREYDIKTKQANRIALVVSEEIGNDKAAIELEISSSWTPGQKVVKSIIDGEEFVFLATPIPEGYKIHYRGSFENVYVRTPMRAELAKLMPEIKQKDMSGLLLCPMPGVVVDILVSEGDEVQDGQALAIVEAMKMENTLRAEKKAVVSKINAKKGDNLAVDAVIMEFE